MALLKATTEIEPSDSIGHIVALLTQMGATSTTLRSIGGKPTALEFTYDTPYGERAFRLPARISQVLETITADWQVRKAKLKSARPTREQAERTAWRILHAWCQAQLALIQVGLATADEVMMPYMLVAGEHGPRTVYEDYVAHQPALTAGRAAS